MAGARLHQRLGFRKDIEARGGNVDVFRAIHTLDLPLLLRPLQGLLGAYLSGPAAGVLVTTQRPMSIQRFTAAHELGHFTMRHLPSLDDESLLRRMPMAAEPTSDFQEIEADAFAVEFMMPRWLIQLHAGRQGWSTDDFRKPNRVYQLALRIGASYEATCWTLVRHRLITPVLARELLQTQPRELKAALLAAYKPRDYRGDVWLLTEHDAGADAVAPLKHISLLADLALEDVDIEVTGQPLFRFGICVEWFRKGPFAWPAIKNLGEILHGSSL